MRPISLARMCVQAYVRALIGLMEALADLNADPEVLEIVRTALGHLIIAWNKLEHIRSKELEAWKNLDLYEED